jgi:hypothetical protein
MDASEAAGPPSGPTQVFMALPTPAQDATAIFHACLADLVRLVSADVGLGDGTRQWENAARAAIRQGLRARDSLHELFFDALVHAGIYDPDPSLNAQFVRPAVAAFGRERVQTALLGFLREGTNPERAGAARAWYWTGMSSKYVEANRAEWKALAGLRSAWREAALREFVSNEDIDVRRCILPGLPLSSKHYPADLHALVTGAVGIARTHPDEYIRHRVEIQVRS